MSMVETDEGPFKKKTKKADKTVKMSRQSSNVYDEDRCWRQALVLV